MTLPDYQSLMLPVLRVASEGETSVPLAEDDIASAMNISDADRQLTLPSGKQRVLHNRIHWAKFYLTKAGLLNSPKRGRFNITPAGSDVLNNLPSKLDTHFLLTLPGFSEWYKSNQTVNGATDANEAEAPIATPEEVVETAFKATQSALRAELLDRILQNSPGFFERVIVELLISMGYGGSRQNAAQQLGQSGDGGVDGVINEDLLGLDRIYVQAKRYAVGNNISRPDVQSFTGSLVGLGASKGVFVTTSAFSQHAIDFAAKIPQRVILIDGRRLTELLVDHGVGVRVEKTLEFKRLDEDFFSED